MAITDDDKQLLTSLVFRALDNIEENFGEDAVMSAGFLITEIQFTMPDGNRVNQIAWFPTDSRGSINFGLLEMARLAMIKTNL